MSDENIDAIVSQLADAIGLTDDNWALGELSDSAFVTRSGQTYQFPAVQVTFSLPNPEPNLPDIDYIVVGSDLIRIAWHALADARHRTPGVSASTAVRKGLVLSFEDVIDPSLVNADEFAKIEQWAGQIEAAAGAGASRLIRGIGLISLNNEALASVIETSIAVIARKASERILWCYFACESNEAEIEEAGLQYRSETISFSGGTEYQIGRAEERP